MGLYLRPRSMEEALRALGGGGLTVIAGGTDFYPARLGRPLDEDLLDVTAIADFRGITDHGSHWRIGGGTTWSDLLQADLPALFDGLKAAAREVGGVQIQNAGTIAGNLCNASPAADGVPALMAMAAEVELASIDGTRRLALADFILGSRRTARRDDELLAAILVPRPAGAAVGQFLKLGSRRYLVISIVAVAVVLEADDIGRILRAAVAVGACAPVPRRLPALEAALAGRPAGGDLGALPEAAHLAPLAPIDDIRAGAEYRLDAALTLVRRALAQAGRRL